MKRTILSIMAFTLLCYGGNGYDWLVSQLVDGRVWFDRAEVDYISTLCALDLLNCQCGYESSVNECRAAILSDTKVGLYPVMARAIVSGNTEELHSYMDGEFIREIGASPDLLSNIWACRLLGSISETSIQWTEVVDFILREMFSEYCWGMSGEYNRRLSLFALSSLVSFEANAELLCDIDEYAMSLEAADNVELALLLEIACGCGDWENAILLRRKLLEVRNTDGAWSEDVAHKSSVLATCLCLKALNHFLVDKKEVGCDLDVPVECITYDGETLCCMIFNNGIDVATSYKLRVQIYDGENNLIVGNETSCNRLASHNVDKIIVPIETSADAKYVVIVADAEGTTGDVDISNNVAVYRVTDDCSCAFFELMPLRAGGNSLDTPLFLGVGHGVELQSAVAMSDDGEAQCKLYDNGELIWCGASLGNISVDWFPVSGEHHLELVAQRGGRNCSITGTAQVIYENALLRTISCKEFRPREYVELEALSSYKDYTVEIRVLNESGLDVGEAAVTEKQNRFQWHTGSNLPGKYTACAIFRDCDNVLTTATTEFEIKQEVAVRSFEICEPGKNALGYAGNDWMSPLSFVWNCAANTNAKVHISWCLKDEDGVELDWGRGDVDADVDIERYEQYTQIDVPLWGQFIEDGMYILHAKIEYDDCVLMDERKIEVRRKPTIFVSSRAMPNVIGTDAAVVKTVIELNGNAENYKGKISSFHVENTPLRIVDSASSVLKICLTDIRDVRGNLISEGKYLCSVMYGMLDGGELYSVAGRTEGCAMQFDIVNGKSEFSYIPSGTANVAPGEIVPICIWIRNEMEILGAVQVFLFFPQNTQNTQNRQK